MDFAFIHSIWTVIAFVMFVAIAIWAFHRRNRKKFDEASRMALDEQDSTNEKPENSHG